MIIVTFQTYPDKAVMKMHPEQRTGKGGGNRHDLSHNILNDHFSMRASFLIKPNLQLCISNIEDKKQEHRLDEKM